MTTEEPEFTGCWDKATSLFVKWELRIPFYRSGEKGAVGVCAVGPCSPAGPAVFLAGLPTPSSSLGALVQAF